MPTATTEPAIRDASARSWLLTPGTHLNDLAAATLAGPDRVVADLEDGVVLDSKDIARDTLRQWLRTHPTWVRISDVRSPNHADDIAAVRGACGLRGIILAKAESADDVAAVADSVPWIPIIPMIESARALLRAVEIAEAKATVRIAFGVGDYRHDCGNADTPRGVAYARAHLVVASRAAGLPGPIDGPSSHHIDLRRDLDLATEVGMTGKLAVRAADTPIINSFLTPTAETVREATATVARLGENGERVTSGADVPKLAAAKATLRRADEFGKQQGS